MTDNMSDSGKEIGRLKDRSHLDRAHAHTVRLVDSTDPSEGGTGVAIRFGHRFFVATAAHVAQPGHQLSIVLRSPLCHEITVFQARHRDTTGDVAVLELDAKTAIASSLDFLSHEHLQCPLDANEERPVVVIGYPGEYLTALGQEAYPPRASLEFRCCSAFTYCSQTMPFERWPNRERTELGLRDCDMFVDFDPESRIEILCPDNALSRPPSVEHKAPAIGGVSGGGIWLRESDVINGVWRAAPRLLGLQISCSNGGKWLRGTTIDRIVDLISEHYPDVLHDSNGTAPPSGGERK